jgi:hypothetical protein
MSGIQIPTSDFGEVTRVADLLTHISKWNGQHTIPKRGYHSRAWFRGHSKRTYKLELGVYCDEFTTQALTFYGKDAESQIMLGPPTAAWN